MKIDRLLGILVLLIHRKKVTARELAEHFEVTLRTIQRDMASLEAAGIPFYAEVGAKGGYSLLENFSLEKGVLSEEETGILIPFLKGLEGVVPYGDVPAIRRKFSCPDAPGGADDKWIVKLDPPSNTRAFREHLDLLSQGRDKLRKVAITYYDVNFRITRRVIRPHCLLLQGTVWYSYAYCDLRRDFRMFKISRIAACTLLEEPFVLQTLPSPLPWDVPGERQGESEEILLEIDRKVQSILPDYCGPANCRVSEDKILVRLDFPVEEWVYTLVMSLTPHVRVLKPASLREEVVRRLQKALAVNSFS